MRNPMNSWGKSDSLFNETRDFDPDDYPCYFKLGENDCNLMKRLRNAGNDHAKFMRMINVTVDITAPLYWWKEFDTYKVGTVANSCSTMHKIHDKEFELSDFSREHLFDNNALIVPLDSDFRIISNKQWLLFTVDILNGCRKAFLETKDKRYWWQMIQLLPSSYNQKRTVQLNYAVLRNMYKSRKNHKLDEWRDLCKWIEELPYSEFITGGE